MRRLVSRPEVEHDLASAIEWYNGKRPGLGREFLDEYLAAIDRLIANPFHFGFAATGLRACRLKRFPYIVHFDRTEDHILVVAVMAGGRDFSTIKKRRG